MLECLWQQQQCRGAGVLGVRDSVGTGIIILKITCDRHIMKSHTLMASNNHRRGYRTRASCHTAAETRGTLFIIRVSLQISVQLYVFTQSSVTLCKTAGLQVRIIHPISAEQTPFLTSVFSPTVMTRAYLCQISSEEA